MRMQKGCEFKRIDDEAGVLEMLALIIMFITCAFLASNLTGCMQLTGAKKIDLWGATFESNAGFEVSAGAMQYDHALDRKGYAVQQKVE